MIDHPPIDNCGKCGAKAMICYDNTGFACFCTKCKNEDAKVGSRESAIAAWNRRQNPTPESSPESSPVEDQKAFDAWCEDNLAPSEYDVVDYCKKAWQGALSTRAHPTPDLEGLIAKLAYELDLHCNVMPPSIMEQIVRQHFGSEDPEKPYTIDDLLRDGEKVKPFIEQVRVEDGRTWILFRSPADQRIAEQQSLPDPLRIAGIISSHVSVGFEGELAFVEGINNAADAIARMRASEIPVMAAATSAEVRSAPADDAGQSCPQPPAPHSGKIKEWGE